MAWYEVYHSSAGGSSGLAATEIIVITAEIEDIQPLEPEQENS